MKHALVFIPLVLATGCSPLLYPGDYGYRRPLPSPYAMRTMAPLPVGRWDNVMRLPPQSTIDVLTLDGVPKTGPIVGADGQSVVVQVNGTDVRVARAQIVRVDLVDPAGSEAAAVARSTARGALLGVGAAAVIGAVIGGPAWPPPGVLLRAGVAGGAATGAQAALANRQPRIIYLAPGQGRSSSRIHKCPIRNGRATPSTVRSICPYVRRERVLAVSRRPVRRLASNRP